MLIEDSDSDEEVSNNNESASSSKDILSKVGFEKKEFCLGLN